METFKSNISGSEFPISEKIAATNLRESIYGMIETENPEFNRNSLLSVTELNHFRQKYLENYLIKETGELSQLENEVLESITKKELITVGTIADIDDAGNTLGQRLADKVASFGGSWKFIILFTIIIIVWITINIMFLADKGFDPYPFILLNLILSCLAALQAPVIMMSQNRQEEKDRERSQQDYMVNLKAELEIRTLHEKLDHLIINQQQELLNIQQIQMEKIDEIMKQISELKN
jgi:uncharacterized membrane protein